MYGETPIGTFTCFLLSQQIHRSSKIYHTLLKVITGNGQFERDLELSFYLGYVSLWPEQAALHELICSNPAYSHSSASQLCTIIAGPNQCPVDTFNGFVFEHTFNSSIKSGCVNMGSASLDLAAILAWNCGSLFTYFAVYGTSDCTGQSYTFDVASFCQFPGFYLRSIQYFGPQDAGSNVPPPCFQVFSTTQECQQLCVDQKNTSCAGCVDYLGGGSTCLCETC